MPIFRRTNCIITASGIVTRKLVIEISLYYDARSKINIKLRNAEQAKRVHRYTNTKIKLYKNNAAIWYNKTCKSDDTICCDNTICPPEDGHVNVRNMSRILK